MNANGGIFKKASICILLGCLLLAPGCAKKKEPGRPQAEVTVRKKNAVAEVKDLETGVEVVVGATEIPRQFPRDLPLYKDAELNSNFVLSNTLVATFFTEAPIAEVKAYFGQESLLKEQGWEIIETKENSSGFEIHLQKDKRRSQISLSQSLNPPGTNISYVANLE